MTDHIRQFVIQLLAEKGRLPEGERLDDYHYLDTGHIDSLSFIKFIFRIEERFGFQFLPDDLASDEIRTVGGLARLIERHKVRP